MWILATVETVCRQVLYSLAVAFVLVVVLAMVVALVLVVELVLVLASCWHTAP